MLGKDAFCPKSGAPLSEERHYDESGRPRRAVEPGAIDGDRSERAGVDDADDAVPVGELTNGARRSSTRALIRHFRRCHQRHREAAPTLYRTVSTAVTRLKRAASGRQAWDVHVWYALQERLRRQGHDVEWMGGHASVSCPRCHGRLRFERPGTEVRAYCGSNCGGTGVDRLPEIRSVVANLLAAAFGADEAPDPESVLQFDA
jgi:hypothetical protein